MFSRTPLPPRDDFTSFFRTSQDASERGNADLATPTWMSGGRPATGSTLYPAELQANHAGSRLTNRATSNAVPQASANVANANVANANGGAVGLKLTLTECD